MVNSEGESIARGLCLQCKTPLKWFEQGLSCGWECAACDWSVVTTNYRHPIFDRTKYDIWLVSEGVDRKKAVAAAVLIFNIEVATARSTSDERRPVCRHVSAADVRLLLRDAMQQGLRIRTEPPKEWYETETAAY